MSFVIPRLSRLDGATSPSSLTNTASKKKLLHSQSSQMIRNMPSMKELYQPKETKTVNYTMNALHLMESKQKQEIDSSKVPESLIEERIPSTGFKAEVEEFGNANFVFPSVFPASRKEVAMLEDWLTKKITQNKIKNARLEKKEQLETSYKTYSTCMHEIMRQVTTSCFERGMLMYHTWLKQNEVVSSLFGYALELVYLFCFFVRVCLQKEKLENEKITSESQRISFDHKLAIFQSEKENMARKIATLEEDQLRLNRIVNQYQDMTHESNEIAVSNQTGRSRPNSSHFLVDNTAGQKQTTNSGLVQIEKLKREAFENIEILQARNDQLFNSLHEVQEQNKICEAAREELRLLEREKLDIETRTGDFHKFLRDNKASLTSHVYSVLESENLFLMNLVSDLKQTSGQYIEKTTYMSKSINVLLKQKRELEDKMELMKQELLLLQQSKADDSQEGSQGQNGESIFSQNSDFDLNLSLPTFSTASTFTLSELMLNNKADPNTSDKDLIVEDIDGLQKKLAIIERGIWLETADFAASINGTEQLAPLELDRQFWMQRILEAELVREFLNPSINPYNKGVPRSDFSENEPDAQSKTSILSKELVRWLKHRNFLLARRTMLAEFSLLNRLKSFEDIDYKHFVNDFSGSLFRLMHVSHLQLCRDEVLNAALRWSKSLDVSNENFALNKKSVPLNSTSSLYSLMSSKDFSGDLSDYFCDIDSISNGYPDVKPVTWLLSMISNIFKYSDSIYNHDFSPYVASHGISSIEFVYQLFSNYVLANKDTRIKHRIKEDKPASTLEDEFISSLFLLSSSITTCTRKSMKCTMASSIRHFFLSCYSKPSDVDKAIVQFLSTCHQFRSHPRVEFICQFLHISTELTPSKKLEEDDLLFRKRLDAKRNILFSCASYPAYSVSVNQLISSVCGDFDHLRLVLSRLKLLSTISLPPSWRTMNESQLYLHSFIRTVLVSQVNMPHLEEVFNIVNANIIENQQPNFRNLYQVALKEINDNKSKIPIAQVSNIFSIGDSLEKVSRHRIELFMSLFLPLTPQRHASFLEDRMLLFLKDSSVRKFSLLNAIRYNLSCFSEEVNIDLLLAAIIEAIEDACISDATFLYGVFLSDFQVEEQKLEEKVFVKRGSILSNRHSLNTSITNITTKKNDALVSEMPNSLRHSAISLSVFQSKINFWFPEIPRSAILRSYDILSDYSGKVIDQIDFVCLMSSMFSWDIEGSPFIAAYLIALAYSELSK